MIPNFTHAELMCLAEAMAQFVENNDEIGPPLDAMSAQYKLDVYVESLGAPTEIDNLLPCDQDEVTLGGEG